jgi:serine/threonine protein kinase
MPPLCPPQDQLSSLLQGTLEPLSAEQVREHLETCEKCLATVHSLSGSEEAFLKNLRQAAVESVDLVRGAESMLARLHALGTDGTIDTVALQKPSPSSAAADLQMIRGYQLLEKLGEGGMGAVYKALHMRLGKTVALKVLPQNRTQDQAAVARFQREMKAVGQLEHGNIVRAMDAGEVDGLHYLVMEYVPGWDLGQLATRLGPLPVADACELVRQAALGLEVAHEHGMVHRDIKPSNLILAQPRRKQEQATVKILDLGLALLGGAFDDNGLTGSGQMMGTVDYMAPEQCRSSHDVDIRADIYALGATLYRLLAGRSPLGGDRDQSILAKLTALATKPPPPLASFRNDLPPQLVAIVERMLAKEPEQRFSMPEEVVAALTPYCGGANLSGLLQRAQGATDAANQAGHETLANRQSGSWDTAPTVQKPAQPTAAWWSRLPPRIRATLIGAGGAMALALLGIVLYLVTNNGTVKIEVNDPEIKVRFENQTAFVENADEREMRISAGKHNLHVERGDFKFDTTDIEITRGGEVTLKVEWLPGELRVIDVKSGQKIGSEKRMSPAAAELPPRMEVVEPPGLEEWLKGRKIRTVAQNGSGEFMSINAAFKAVQSGEVIEVIDRGPYAETIEARLPSDVGLISRQKTVLHPLQARKKGLNADDPGHGHGLNTADRFRLHGFEFRAAPADRGKDWSTNLALFMVGDTVVENCLFRDASPNPSAIKLSWNRWANNNARCVVRDCAFDDTLAVNSGYGPDSTFIALEHNWFRERDTGGNAIWVAIYEGRGGRVLIRENISATTAFTLLDTIEGIAGIEVSNNSFLIGNLAFNMPAADAAHTTVVNNLFGNQFSALGENRSGSTDGLRSVRNNRFGRVGNTFQAYPHADSNLVGGSPLLSSRTSERDYARIEADSRDATAGIGAPWPSYLGALPPGPAPIEGDWFTRLRKRWGESAK